MKKITTLFLILFTVQVYAQEPVLRLTGSTKDVQRDSVRPLIEINYQGEKVSLGKFGNLNDLSPEWVSSITVLKDKSAVALYGKDGKDGVIIIELKQSPESKEYFEKEALQHKKLTRIDKYQDASNSSFSDEKTRLNVPNQAIKIQGEIDYLDNPPMIILELGDEKLELGQVQDLDEVKIGLIDEIEVLKDSDSLKRYNAENRSGVVVMKMKSGKKSAKAFKKLKKAQKKNK